MSEETQNNIGRRRLLRRASTVAAGVVGAGAVGATVSSPAQAAPGDALVEGANTKMTPTSFVGDSADALLTLENAGGAALLLGPSGDLGEQIEAGVKVPVGSISVNGWGDLQVIQYPGQVDYLYTSLTTSQMNPISPQRLLDTRTSEGRKYVINPGVLDSSGRMKPDTTIHLRLDYFISGASAMHGNLTATGATRSGYLVVFPYGTPKPPTSTLNYPPSSTLGSLANAFVVGHGWKGDYPNGDETDAISIYNAGGLAHVLLDINAFTYAAGWAVLGEGLEIGSDPAARKAGGTKLKGRGPAPRPGQPRQG
ncbi:hypothetical protein [Asanoa siamensis]|uniref:Uncharacterized protein n=1 Tax=Asanoa siamensis TaxID=926357 RepID=A0ABQ4CIM1_9ACTN|nr:hypothetical protein [Asanoa siamensis]GIF71144.1 hypothetical protein Asi02nite_06620 [Asanoa siamensis]